MKQVKKWWMAVLLSALLIAVLTGAAGARSSARPEAAAIMGMTIPAAACIPLYVDHFPDQEGNVIQCGLRDCQFVCPFDFPEEGTWRTLSAHVRRLMAYVYDGSGMAPITVDLYKTNPGVGTKVLMARLQGGALFKRDVLSTTNIKYRSVTKSYGTFIFVEIPYPGQKVYGFRIVYSR